MSETEIDGGALMARSLVAHGVRTVFCLSGTAHTFLLRELDRLGVAIIGCRHESGVVLAADGYARASGRLGVALIKNDQGLPNAMTGICTANAACSPVLVLSSMSPTPGAEAGGDVHETGLELARPVAKWVRAVPAPERLGEFLGTAIRQARAGRPGVALLGIPQEFQRAKLPAAAPMPVHPLPEPAVPSAVAIAALADMLLAAERPMLLAGGGALNAGAGAVLNRLADRGLPVIGNSLGRGLVAEDGRRGFSWPFAQAAAKQADVVICAGIRLTQRMGYGLPPRFAAEARFAQIDIQPEEPGRNRPVDLALHGDVRATLEALEAELDRRAAGPLPGSDWINAALAARAQRIDGIGRDDAVETHPYRIGRALAEYLPLDAVLVGDGADLLNWLHGVFFLQRPRCYMDHYPFGSMGVGTGLALGAAAAMRDEAAEKGDEPRQVVLLTGDGAFGFYCAELDSFARAGLPLTVLIGNDGAWGTEYHGQMKALGQSWNCLLEKSDYQLVGQAFGFQGRAVTHAAEVGPAVAAALVAGERQILNIHTDTAAGALRKSDPLVQTVAFEDLPSSLKTHYAPDVA